MSKSQMKRIHIQQGGSMSDFTFNRWRPIETAPKDGTEILGWREDCGVILVRYTAMIDFMSENEINFERSQYNLTDETIEAYDWFCADFISGCRLERDESPTLWMPKPSEPEPHIFKKES